MWKNLVQPEIVTDDIIRRVRFACWKTKATDTHTLRIFSTYCFGKLKMVTETNLYIALYKQCLSCFKELFQLFT